MSYAGSFSEIETEKEKDIYPCQWFQNCYTTMSLQSWTRSYQFRHHVARIIRRGLGITVAMALDSVIIRSVGTQEPTLGSLSLWLYAILVTLFTCFVLLCTSQSSWIAKYSRDDSSDQDFRDLNTRKSTIPKLAFQGGEEDEIIEVRD